MIVPWDDHFRSFTRRNRQPGPRGQLTPAAELGTRRGLDRCPGRGASELIGQRLARDVRRSTTSAHAKTSPSTGALRPSEFKRAVYPVGGTSRHRLPPGSESAPAARKIARCGEADRPSGRVQNRGPGCLLMACTGVVGAAMPQVVVKIAGVTVPMAMVSYVTPNGGEDKAIGPNWGRSTRRRSRATSWRSSTSSSSTSAAERERMRTRST